MASSGRQPGEPDGRMGWCQTGHHDRCPGSWRHNGKERQCACPERGHPRYHHHEEGGHEATGASLWLAAPIPGLALALAHAHALGARFCAPTTPTTEGETP